MKTRRGPWLSGLIVALLGASWMIGQVLGGVVSMVGRLLSVDSPATTLSAPNTHSADCIEIEVSEKANTFLSAKSDWRFAESRSSRVYG